MTSDSPENNTNHKQELSNYVTPIKSYSEIPNMRLNTNSTHESGEFQKSYMEMS